MLVAPLYCKQCRLDINLGDKTESTLLQNVVLESTGFST